jgi:hypothetical protein
MNTKPNNPDELLLGKSFSPLTDLKVNSWGYFAMFLSFAGDILFYCYKVSGEWPGPVLRAIIAIAPLFPFLLWLRAFTRWVSGMDELHRRIQVATCLFATGTTLFLFMALYPLKQWGVFPSQLSWIIDCNSWWIKCVPLGCFYLIGYPIFNRRYK